MKNYLTLPFFTPVLALCTWLLFAGVILLFFPQMVPSITDDGQAIDLITIGLYVIMFLTFMKFFKDFKQEKKFTDYFIFLFLAAAALLRELGIQHWLASKDTTAFKMRFYTNPNNPLSEKIIAILITLVLIIALGYLAIKYGKHLFTSFFKKNTMTWSIATLCVIGIAGKVIDRIPGNYRKWTGTPLNEHLAGIMEVWEETSEALLPLITIIILWQYHILIQTNSEEK